MNDSNSLQNCFPEIQSLCDKIDLLLLNIDFIDYAKNSKKDCRELLKNNQIKMENIQIKLKTVTHLLKKYKENYYQLQIQEEKVGKQIQILDSVQVPMEKEFTATETIENGISQNHYVSISPDLEKPETVKAKITPKYIIFGISPLTPEEYELIPQYIHRRMGLDSINSFIEVINNSVSNKYQLLSKLASSLKGDKLKLYKEFKKQQNGTMKDRRFITELDIAREYNKSVLERKCTHMLMLLVHCKKLVRTVISSKAYFIVE